MTRETRSYEVTHVHGLWHLDFHEGSRPVPPPNSAARGTKPMPKAPPGKQSGSLPVRITLWEATRVRTRTTPQEHCANANPRTAAAILVPRTVLHLAVTPSRVIRP